MEQIDLNEPVQAELGRLTMRAVAAETALRAANTRIHELEAELAMQATALLNGASPTAKALHD